MSDGLTLGSVFSVTLDVTNHGNKTAQGTLDTLFEMSTSGNGSNPFQVANVTVPIKIKPGASEILHLNVPTALGGPTGEEYIVAVLDPMNAFDEPSLSNNTAISLTRVDFS